MEDNLFWDSPAPTAPALVRRPMPAIPETGWRAPREFPNLRAATAIALDTETYDPNLLTHGPGWARGDGHIIGVSVAVDGGQWYFPVRHTIEPETNLSPEHVFAWLRDTLGNPAQPKFGANLPYDIGWLAQEGVRVVGALFDVQHAEALLNERGEVNLEYLGEKYCGRGKDVDVLYTWLAAFYGGPVSGRQRANLWRAPPRLVGPYAERDAELPLQVARAQQPLLEAEGLSQVRVMEDGLIPLMVAMRFAGVSVNLDRAEALRVRLLTEEESLLEKLLHITGQRINVNAAESIAQAFDAAGVPYLRTAKGKPSFVKDWLEHHESPIAQLVTGVRRVQKLRGTFVEGAILNSHVNGKIYGQFHLLRSDDGGTRSGRFSSSTPNLQNIPSRDEELAPLVRGIFIPDRGHKQWRRFDYSQIEYRFLVHFAIGAGVEEALRRYRENPNTDYHDLVIEMIRAITGYVLARKPAKNINFGLIYGMGIAKLLRVLGLDKITGDALFAAYHQAIPYAKATMEATSAEAHRLGYITTILGRRSRFDLWEQDGGDYSDDRIALPYEQAVLTFPRMRRAYTHKALNRRLQGSAADMMKLAMWRCWEDGVFAATGVPRLTVHDELDFSDTGDCDDAFAYMKHVLETCLPLRVPVRADEEIGPDWGSAK